MDSSFDLLESAQVWSLFEQMSQIPRPSKQEAAVLAWVEALLDAHGQKGSESSMAQISSFRDEVGNLIIKKSASKGCEHWPMLCLQGHVDMVCQKTPSKEHDFSKDPILWNLEDGWLMADETTLGADNGIGVCMILALMLSTDIDHGPLEALLTIDEEAGMSGAMGLKPHTLESKFLINLDSEQEGEVCVGCAGGIDLTAQWEFSTEAAPATSQAYMVKLSGLYGGHSGVDIHLGRGNANRLLARFILENFPNAQMSRFVGGSLRNAIPREAQACLWLGHGEHLDDKCRAFEKVIQSEMGPDADDLKLEVIPVQGVGEASLEPVLSEADTALFCTALQGLPDGVMGMNPTQVGMVDVSSNLAIVTLEKGHAQVDFLIRASWESQKQHALERIRRMCQALGAATTASGSYPGWAPEPSALLDMTLEVTQDVLEKEAKVIVMHAGLECGVIQATHPEMKMVSFGPTIEHPHSPWEKVEVNSVDKTWTLLLCLISKAERLGS